MGRPFSTPAQRLPMEPGPGTSGPAPAVDLAPASGPGARSGPGETAPSIGRRVAGIVDGCCWNGTRRSDCYRTSWNGWAPRAARSSSSAAKPGSARPRSSTRSRRHTPRLATCASAPATTCSSRSRWAPSGTSPALNPRCASRSTTATDPTSSRRSWRCSPDQHDRRSSSSRTRTGPTRRPLMPSGTWVGASAGRTASWSSPTVMARSTTTIPCEASSGTSPPRTSSGCSWRACRWGRCRHSSVDPASTLRMCTRPPAATPSSWARWPRWPTRRSHPRSTTR